MAQRTKTLDKDIFEVTLKGNIVILNVESVVTWTLYVLCSLFLQNYSQSALEAVQAQLKIAQKTKTLCRNLFEVNC